MPLIPENIIRADHEETIIGDKGPESQFFSGKQ